ncbi:alpha/beta hydrolase [Actinoplanes rectilineatus]|uniref:alpha/beta hydrolase n=1 Tax=Actinoplanes rectilineatus TaxID=113571 RepID=UPI000696E84C|nr:alpha/beta fold hydrolase [Actinoplanes rectilineatus]
MHTSTTAQGLQRLRVVASLTLLLITAVFAPTSAAHAHSRSSPHPGQAACKRHDTSITLTPERTAPHYRIAGWLCIPRGGARTVQLLVSGFTYDHTYWTGLSASTNWTAGALAHGDAVYLIDRPGVGASDRPPATQVTVGTEAEALHQIATGLRDGRIARFANVIGVGHSYGSIVLAAEAAAHRDFNALVLTGKLFDYNQPGLKAFQNSLYPASSDPKFARSRVPDGYVTTPPGTRAGFFLDTSTAVPGAARWQEASKAVGTSGELATMTADAYIAASRQITIPVLLIVGSHDSLFCNTTRPCGTGTELCQRTHGFYSPGTPVDTLVVPGAGHAIDLHRGAAAMFTAANRWISRTVTRTGPRPAVTTCQR